MSDKNVVFFFGAGAELGYGLKGGDSFSKALLRFDYKKECASMLGKEYERYALVYPSSTKVYLQTIDKYKDKAQKCLAKDDFNKCIEYIADRNSHDYYEIREICKKWYKSLLSGVEDKVTAFFLQHAVFCESLDSKFNALRNALDDRTGDAKRVISAYMNVFILMLKDIYEINNSFDWNYQNVIDLLRDGKPNKLGELNTYYAKLKNLVELVLAKEKEEMNNKHLSKKELPIRIATSNYTPYIEKCIGISPAYLHGRMNWFEDYERLLVYDVLVEREEVLDRKDFVFPFIMIPSGVKPLICKKQIDEYGKFVDMMDTSSILCVVGYRFNSEDNHINSIIGEWLKQNDHKLIYFNFDGQVALEKLPWLDKKLINQEIYTTDSDFFQLMSENRILSVIINSSNCISAFDKFLESLKNKYLFC